MKKNIGFVATFVFALTIVFSCEQASNETANNSNDNEPSESVVDDNEMDETTDEVTDEVTDEPQTIDARILEIKELYAQVQGSTVTSPGCRTNSVKDVNYDIIPEGFPTVNSAKECQLENDLMYQRVEMNGYEWSETTTFYAKNGVRFFAYTRGGAEGCGYDYRVYYDKEGAVIRVLLAENECDGKNVSAPFEVTDEGRKKEILAAAAAAEKEFQSILN